MQNRNMDKTFHLNSDAFMSFLGSDDFFRAQVGAQTALFSAVQSKRVVRDEPPLFYQGVSYLLVAKAKLLQNKDTFTR